MAKDKTAYYREMLTSFNMDYGTLGTNLNGWQQLCADCGVNPGASITQCKKVRPI